MKEYRQLKPSSGFMSKLYETTSATYLVFSIFLNIAIWMELPTVFGDAGEALHIVYLLIALFEKIRQHWS